jgi:hypothetical protein
MKPRRRPAPTPAAKAQVKAKEERLRGRGLGSTRRAVKTGKAVARLVDPTERRRKPPRKNLRSRASNVARADRAATANRRRAA